MTKYKCEKCQSTCDDKDKCACEEMDDKVMPVCCGEPMKKVKEGTDDNKKDDHSAHSCCCCG